MTNHSRSVLIIAILCILAFTACEQERDPCLQPKNAFVRMGCYRPADTGTAILDTLLPNANLVADSNGILKAFYLGANLSKFNLLLSSVSDSCTWYLQPDSSVSQIDTLSFYYDRSLQFLSNACGYTYYFYIREVKTTNHNIDSIIISNGDIDLNANAPENLKIYF